MTNTVVSQVGTEEQTDVMLAFPEAKHQQTNAFPSKHILF